MNRSQLVAFTAFVKEYQLGSESMFSVIGMIEHMAEREQMSMEKFLDEYIIGRVRMMTYEYDIGFDAPVFESLVGSDVIEQMGYSYVDIMGFTGEMEYLGLSPWETIDEFDL